MAPSLSRADAAHLLRRIGVGGTPAEIAAYTGLSRAAAIDRALDLSAAPPVVRPSVIDTTKSAYEGWFTLLYWWLERLATTPTPLQEKLALFWHGHFATQVDKVLNPRLMWDQHQITRALALGSFRDLCRDVSLSPAMLIFLDNTTNDKGRPQENFARELMELHTIGVGSFTEADVVAMARAWTGHGTTPNEGDRTPIYRFDPEKHDGDLKTLFGIAQNWNGPDTIDALVLGPKRSDCARFIAGKLARFLVSPHPSAALIDSAATAFANASMRIDALVRALLASDEFWAPANRLALVKSPIEFCAHLLRLTGLPMADSGLHFSMPAMGQTPFAPPDVSGWGTGDYWLSTSGAWGRGQWLGYVRWGTAPHGFFRGLSGMSTAAGVQRIVDELAIVEPSPQTRTALSDWFDAMRQSDAAWAIDADAVVVGGMTPEFNLA